MKYYAVTEDPNELMHFGIKGMKWGVIRTPEQLGHHKAPKKPRSPAYMKASAKLSKAMRQGIAKAQANWDTYNSPENKQIRAEKRAINKEISAYNRAEKKFQKHLQQARQGRLKYKGISDEEVSRITDRLALERNSRLLSGTEKASFGRRLRERVGEGVIEGVGRGTSGYISQRMEGRGRTTAEIKGARRKIRSQFTPVGVIHRIGGNVTDYLDDRHSAAREGRKASYKANREARENYLTAVNANRDIGYDDALSNDAVKATLHGYTASRVKSRFMSTGKLKGRTQAIESAKKSYSDRETGRIKNLSNLVEETYEDEDGKTITRLVPGKQQNNQSKNNKKDVESTDSKATVTPHNGPSRQSRQGNTSHNMAYMTSAKYSARRNLNNAINANNEFIKSLYEDPKPEPTYRERLAQMAKEADARQAEIRRREAESQRQIQLAQKAREREEGFAYYKDRRVTREASPTYAIREASSAAAARAYRQQHQAQLAQATQQRASERLRDAQVRTARQNEQKLFNGRTIPSATYPDYTRSKRKGRKVYHASLNDIYNLRG